MPELIRMIYVRNNRDGIKTRNFSNKKNFDVSCRVGDVIKVNNTLYFLYNKEDNNSFEAYKVYFKQNKNHTLFEMKPGYGPCFIDLSESYTISNADPQKDLMYIYFNEDIASILEFIISNLNKDPKDPIKWDDIIDDSNEDDDKDVGEEDYDEDDDLFDDEIDEDELEED